MQNKTHYTHTHSCVYFIIKTKKNQPFYQVDELYFAFLSYFHKKNTAETEKIRSAINDYLYNIVDNYNKLAASLSQTIVTKGCNCNTDAGSSGVTSPCTIPFTAAALFLPETTIKIDFACMMFLMPIESA